MKMGSKLILGTMTALALLSGGVARAQSVPAGEPATLIQAEYENEGGEGEGWLSWIGGHDGEHEGRHGRHGGNDGDHGCGHDDDDDEDEDGGSCGAGAGPQPGTPPANGLFQNGQTPKVQVN